MHEVHRSISSHHAPVLETYRKLRGLGPCRLGCSKSLAQGVHPNMALGFVTSCHSDRDSSENSSERRGGGGEGVRLVSQECDDMLVQDRRR